MIKRKKKYSKCFKDLVKPNQIQKLIIITILTPKKVYHNQTMVIILI